MISIKMLVAYLVLSTPAVKPILTDSRSKGFEKFSRIELKLTKR